MALIFLNAIFSINRLGIIYILSVITHLFVGIPEIKLI